jgi:hypothetical protein
VAKLTQAKIRAALLAYGLPVSAARTLSAISGAETSGSYDPNAIGDTSLETTKWGPSIGVFQIRTLKAETGTGSTRDIQWLQGSLVHQVAAAASISDNGRNFTPWSTYTSGKYQGYLDGAGGTSAENAGVLDGLKGAAGDALGGIAAPLVSGFQSLGFTLAGAAFGLALIGFGLARTFPKATGTAVKALL